MMMERIFFLFASRNTTETQELDSVEWFVQILG
jgi:hypothetical protein